MVMLFTIKNWRLTVIALMAAAVLIFPSLIPGGGNLVLQKAEATTYDITTNTTWGDKRLVSGDVVNVAAGATLTITGTVCCEAEVNVAGTIKLVKTDPTSKFGGTLKVGSFNVYDSGLVGISYGGQLDSSGYIQGTLDIKSGGTAIFSGSVITGTINVYGRLSIFAPAANNAFRLFKEGTVNVNSGGTLNIGGYLDVNGLVDVNPGGTLDVYSSTSGSGGTLNVNSGGTLNIDGKLSNAGTVKINKEGVLRINDPGIFENKADTGLTSIYGTLNINNGAELDNDGRINLNNGGTLKVFTGGILHNDGTLYKYCRGIFTFNPGATFTGNPITGQQCIAINDVTLTEGNSGTKNFGFKVSRSVGTTGTTAMQFATAAGTATAGTDYTTKSATTLTFTAGQTSKTVNIVVKGDTTKEPDETFYVNLSNCNTGCVILDSKGVGTIKNDDGT